jgi:site-specific DNA-methyltransferase (adenine-specific)
MPAGSTDAVVTDPPYGLQSHDRAPRTRRGVYIAGPGYQRWCRAWAEECLRILKPGGHLVAFGGPRTWHRLVCAVEDTGFEIRDSISWIYANGFPKSRTALKPAHEPITLARKPLTGTLASSVRAYGVGAIDVDACRIPVPAPRRDCEPHPGRWPPNVVFSHAPLLDGTGEVVGDACAEGCVPGCPVAALDTQTGILTSGHMTAGTRRRNRRGYHGLMPPHVAAATIGDSGGASRFYPAFRYHARATRSERPSTNGLTHPTVKPVGLVAWLIRLVTPPHALVLDPFAGSGTTGEACLVEGRRAILIEREPDHLPLITVRLKTRIRED